MTKPEVWQLGILNAGGRIQQLREEGLPIATVWISVETGLPVRDDDGQILAWHGERLLGHAVTRQPSRAIAAYQLCCEKCGTVDRGKLGWRRLGPESWELAEFAACLLCVKCLADFRGSESWTRGGDHRTAAAAASSPSEGGEG